MKLNAFSLFDGKTYRVFYVRFAKRIDFFFMNLIRHRKRKKKTTIRGKLLRKLPHRWFLAMTVEQQSDPSEKTSQVVHGFTCQ